MSNSLGALAQQYGQNSVPIEVKPDGQYVGRIRSLADRAEGVEKALSELLHALRGATPPTPATEQKATRMSCVGDHLNRHEDTLGRIQEMLQELGTLI